MWLVRINGSTKSQHGWCLKRKAASLLTPPSPSAAGADTGRAAGSAPALPTACGHSPLVQPEGRDKPGWDGSEV